MYTHKNNSNTKDLYKKMCKTRNSYDQMCKKIRKKKDKFWMKYWKKYQA